MTFFKSQSKFNKIELKEIGELKNEVNSISSAENFLSVLEIMKEENIKKMKDLLVQENQNKKIADVLLMIHSIILDTVVIIEKYKQLSWRKDLPDFQRFTQRRCKQLYDSSQEESYVVKEANSLGFRYLMKIISQVIQKSSESSEGQLQTSLNAYLDVVKQMVQVVKKGLEDNIDHSINDKWSVKGVTLKINKPEPEEKYWSRCVIS